MINTNVTAIRGGEEKAERKINASMPFNEQVSMLDALIRRPPTNSRVIEFSPKLAEHILTKLNLNNRPMKTAKIKKYAEDLAEGLWGLTGDTIKFGTDGLLKDGQNRLSACVRAGRPMASHAVFGIDPGYLHEWTSARIATGLTFFRSQASATQITSVPRSGG
jgi:hypothetical protein